MIFKILIDIFGSLALFLFGMKIMGKGLQRLAGNKLREFIKKLTSTKLSELGTGILLGSVMQSSGSAMAMVIGLVNANLMTLKQTVAIILGAGIGGTIIVQLIAFRISQYALLILGLGFFFLYIRKGKTSHNIGNILIGFGLLLLALQFFGKLIGPIQTGIDLKKLIIDISNEPIVGILVATFFTAIFNSSSVMLGIVITIAQTTNLDLYTTMPLVLGANLGTCITSIIASLDASPEAKRVALLHVAFKGLGILLFLPILEPITTFLSSNNFDISRQIANSHTFFNTVTALIFLPFCETFANISAKLIPSPATNGEDVGFKIKYLDYKVIDNPILALGNTQREIRRLTDRVQEMFDKLILLITKNDEEFADQIEKKEQETDTLSKAIVEYLSELGLHPLTPEESKKAASLLYIVNDLEHIGDVVSRLTKLGRKKIENALLFSEEGLNELKEMHQIVRNNLDMAVIAALTSDIKLANKVIQTNEKLIRMERDLRQKHIGRLWAGQKFTLETSSIHLDIINGLQKINEHAVNIAHAVVGELT